MTVDFIPSPLAAGLALKLVEELCLESQKRAGHDPETQGFFTFYEMGQTPETETVVLVIQGASRQLEQAKQLIHAAPAWK